jgi:RNA polymerase sigma-70 factor (ECF subfamily)
MYLTVVRDDDFTQVTSAFRRGEVWAFRRAAEEFFGPITNFLAHLVGSVDTAQDLAQEAFFAAFRSHKSFREDAPLAPWIFRIARNLAYQELNRRRKQRKTSLDELIEKESGEPPAEDSSPHEESVEKEMKERINLALARLKPGFRDAVILRLVQGYSGQETAALLGIPLATVNTRVHRGIRELRKTLRREGIDERALLG